jgi:hypothetical protein
MKKLLTWGAIGLLTTAFFDPMIYSALDRPIPWFRDTLMAAGGILCFYLLVKFRDYL